MSFGSFRRLLLVYVAALIVAAIGVRSYVALGKPESPVFIESGWKEGKRVLRVVRDRAEPAEARAKVPDGTVFKVEEVTGIAPMSIHPVFFAFALVPGLDGVKVEVDGKTAYATVDDLLSAQAYDHGGTAFDPSLGLGTHRPTVLYVLSQELGIPPADVAARGRFERVRTKRIDPPIRRIGPNDIKEEDVRAAIEGAARHLARGIDGYGRYRYLIDAPTNTTVPAYNWPRHAGSTYFMAQAAHVLDDPDVRFATLRAASCMRDEMMVACGPHRCIADYDTADVGSSALAIIALVEVVRTGADASYRRAIADLAEFLRSQQRADGELMHLYQRSSETPVDVQFLYYTGEAALALSRAHRITNDPRDLEAASRALHHLATKGWRFFGSRYYYSEEHWTCQAVADLWERAPDRDALEFCAHWHEFQRALQHEEGDSPFDSEGSFGVGPFITPRVTPAASRGEAAGALLEVLRKEYGDNDERTRLVDLELRRAIAFVLRNQFQPGPTHLFAAPEAVNGAFPGSPVDWQVRIDYSQHAGSMLVRWLEDGGGIPYPK